MSFGMIFSIILIIAFLFVAVYAIVKFLDVQENITANQFISNLQNEVDQLWQGSQGSISRDFNVPENVRFVCFYDLSKQVKPGSNRNLYEEITEIAYEEDNAAFYPLRSSNRDRDQFEINHINITKITEIKNPYCFENIGGKVSIILEKKFENNKLESLVTLR